MFGERLQYYTIHIVYGVCSGRYQFFAPETRRRVRVFRAACASSARLSSDVSTTRTRLYNNNLRKRIESNVVQSYCFSITIITIIIIIRIRLLQ